jgi:hypothetical protein
MLVYGKCAISNTNDAKTMAFLDLAAFPQRPHTSHSLTDNLVPIEWRQVARLEFTTESRWCHQPT